MQLYYSNTIDEQHVVLDEIESKHCSKVLRKKVDDDLFVTDGRGILYETKIKEITKKNVIASIIKKTISSNNPFEYCHIAIAPTKNIDRFEWFLEKATEIGIGKITPTICENSERRNIRLDRLEKIVISAMKQSLKTFKPILNDCVTFEEFLSTKPMAEEKFIAHCQNENTPHLFNAYTRLRNVCVLIGPEGDFSLKEIEDSIKAGFVEISLGESRLRTETAGVFATNIIMLKNTLTDKLPG